MTLLYLTVLEYLPEKLHHRHGDVAIEGIIIPFEKRRIGHNPVDTAVSSLVGSEREHSQSARGMSRQRDVGVAVASDLGKGRIDVGIILADVTDIIGILPWLLAASVTPQVDGIEVISRVDEAPAHLRLKEIVVESMNVEIGTSRRALRAQPHYGRAARTVEGLALIDIPGLVTGQYVGMPRRVGLVTFRAVIFPVDIPSRHRERHEEQHHHQWYSSHIQYCLGRVPTDFGKRFSVITSAAAKKCDMRLKIKEC